MKILVLCNKPPYPPSEGGPIAMNMIIEGLINAGHKVRVLAFNSNKTKVDASVLPEEYVRKTGIELIPVDLEIKPVAAFFNLFTNKSYHVERFISHAFKKRLEEILLTEEFDVVQFEMLYMAPYLETVRKFSKAAAILRAHNIEHLVWERVEKTTTSSLKKIYLHHLVRTLKRYEKSVTCRFDGIAAITGKDAEFFRSACGRQGPVVEAIPFGIDLQRYPHKEAEPEYPSLFSIGSMDWMPNSEGIRWFLNEIWPEIRKKFPDLSYYIAGRHMPEWITCCGIPGVKVVGEVKNACDFMQAKGIMVVPLLSGSGIRIKIIEGMANAKPIISTTIGAEGIDYTHGKDIFIADDAEGFVKAISVLMDPSAGKRTGDNARSLIEKEYRQDQIISKLTDFYQKAVS